MQGLDDFLASLFAPDQGSGMSGGGPDFNGSFAPFGPKPGVPNDITALMPPGAQFKPSPGMGSPAGGPGNMTGFGVMGGYDQLKSLLDQAAPPPERQPLPNSTLERPPLPNPTLERPGLGELMQKGIGPDQLGPEQYYMGPPDGVYDQEMQKMGPPPGQGQQPPVNPMAYPPGPDQRDAMLPPNARPVQYVPSGDEGTTDMSARSANGLPVSPPMTAANGTGAGNTGDATTDRLMGVYGGRGTPPLVPGGGNGRVVNPNAPLNAQDNSIVGQLMGMTPRADQRLRAAIAGGMSGGNPAFAGGALMNGISGAAKGKIGVEQAQTRGDILTGQQQQKQGNFDRSQADKEKRTDALTKLYGARTQAAINGRPNNAWNKPPSERYKDAQNLILNKEKSLRGNVNPLANPAERKAQADANAKEMADFKEQTYRAYGFDKDGKDVAPQQKPGGGKAPAGKSGAAPAAGDTADDSGGADTTTHAGTMDDPHEPASQEDFDAMPAGSIFINPADGRTMTKRGS